MHIAAPQSQQTNVDYRAFEIETVNDFDGYNIEVGKQLLKGEHRAVICGARAPELDSLYQHLVSHDYSHYKSDIPAADIEDYFVTYCQDLSRSLPTNYTSQIEQLQGFFIKTALYMREIRNPYQFTFELLKVAKENSIPAMHFDSILPKDLNEKLTPDPKPKLKSACTLYGERATLISSASNVSGNLEFLRKESERFPNYVNTVYLLNRNLVEELPLYRPAIWPGGVDGIPHSSPNSYGRLFFGLQAY